MRLSAVVLAALCTVLAVEAQLFAAITGLTAAQATAVGLAGKPERIFKRFNEILCRLYRYIPFISVIRVYTGIYHLFPLLGFIPVYMYHIFPLLGFVPVFRTVMVNRRWKHKILMKCAHS